MLPLIANGATIIGAANKVRAMGIAVPSAARFIRWCQKTPERWQAYVRAQEIAAELSGDRIRRIAEKAGEKELDPAAVNAQVQRARLRIDTDKWVMAKRHPSRYGDKLQHEHSGSLSVTVATGVDLLAAPPTPRIGVSLDSLLDGDDVRDAQVRVLPAAPASTAAPARLGGVAFGALD